VGVNQAARLRSLAHGGQLLVSRAVADLAGHLLTYGLQLRSLGTHRVRDFPRREEIFQVCRPGRDIRFPPLNAADTSVPPLAAVVSIDIAGASAQVSSLSHERLVALQHRWQLDIQGSFDAQQGRYLKLLGDGCLAIFDTPDSALAFAQSCEVVLAPSGARLRASVHFGPVEQVGDDISGHSLWFTSSIVKLAAPDQILVSPVARELLRDSGSFESLGVHQLPRRQISTELFAANP
jgi:class 3 adenylate cyclase